MTQFEKDINDILPCTCGEIYKSRNLSAPDCPYCQYSDEIIRLYEEDLTRRGVELGIGFYCQRNIEGELDCDNQCEHCKEYYAPLEKFYCKRVGMYSGDNEMTCDAQCDECKNIKNEPL